MGLRKRFGVKWRDDGTFDDAVFEFKDEQSFREALLLFDWATSFFTTESFFTSEDEPGPKHMKKSVSKRRLQEPEAFLDTDSGVLLRLPPPKGHECSKDCRPQGDGPYMDNPVAHIRKENS